MSPLLLGAAWILFVVSCFASMVPSEKPKSPVPKTLVKAEGGSHEKAS